MRILHVYKVSLPDSMGGTEQVIHQLAIGSEARGIKVKVLSLTNDKKYSVIDYFGYEVHKVPVSFELASTGFSFKAFSVFRKLSKEADLIHYHFPWPFMDVLHFLTGVKCKTVVSYHSDIIRQRFLYRLYKPLEKKFLKSVNKIVCSSPNYLLSSDVLKAYLHKVTVIPYGLDKSTYPTLHTKNIKKWQNTFGSKFFLFLGVLRYYKGLHILIDAAAKVDYPIVIGGGGPIELELRAQVSQLGLKNVHFIGYVSDEDKVALVSGSYAIVFPSHLRSEAFGIVLLEAAMFGKPLISSEIASGTTFVNLDKKTGIVVPPSNADALADAMNYLWNSPKAAKKMGQAAERRYRQLFTANRMVEEYIKLYEFLA